MKRLLLLPFIICFAFLNAQEYWMQDGEVTTCSGSFYDSGGPTGFFSNNENYTFTICPDRSIDPEYATVITFLNNLLMEPTPGIDFITIYDGDDTTAPVIGSWQGGQLPGGINGVQASDIGTNPSGCLTVVFISDPAGPGPGWSAEISCQVPCQSIIPSVVTDPAMDGSDIINITEGDTVNFSGSATFSQDGSGATYTWDFGDGNGSNTLDTSHTYNTTGTFTASLTVTDNSGNPDCQSVFTFLVVVSYDDNVPCPSVVGVESVYASDDVYINCDYPLDANDCMVLVADYVSIKETSSYTVQSIPFQPPYPVADGAGIEITRDDYYGPIVNFPSAQDDVPAYRFCFFGEEKDALVVGANGRINFDISRANDSDNWQYTETLPTNTSHMMNTINGAYHDMDITNDPGPNAQFSYGFQGTYPCRMFVVNYNEIPLFSCDGAEPTTQQIILWEGSNYIDVYIHNKSECSWNNGSTLIGLQGPTENQYSVAPGRNTGDWSAQEEAWRFIPDGPELPVTIEWFDENDNLVGTGQELDICPTENTFYTVEVTYQLCGMDPVLVSDVVNITLDFDEPQVDPISEQACDTDGDGEVTWDLYTITSSVYDVSADYVIEGFYTNPRSANDEAVVDLIENPAEYTSESTTIYIRVLNSLTGCHSVVAVTLEVLDDLSVDPYTAALCIPAGATEATFNLLDYSDYFLNGNFYDIYFYLNETDATEGNANYLANDVIQNFTIPENSVVYVRIQSADGCFGVSELNLEISSGPDPYEFAQAVSYCDSPILGEEIVDLTSYEDNIANGATDLVFTYFDDIDAATDYDISLAIADPTQYNLLDTMDTIYIGVTDAAGCYIVVNMPVILSTGLELESQTITLCDIGSDDIELFDLTSIEGNLVTDPDVYTFTYYVTEDDAMNDQDSITDITVYESSIGEVWVNVADASGCSSIININLELTPVPEVNLATLSVCVDASGNYVFDLEEASTDLLDGQTGITLSYFNNETDANDNVVANAIEDIDNYVSTEDGEVIYVRLDATSCYAVSTITLNYNPQPIAMDSPVIEVCDLGTDNSELVNIIVNENIITDGASDVMVSYYTNENDAINASNAIATPTQYELSNGITTIFVRVDNDLGCFAINSFEVNVLDGLTPDMAEISLCDVALDDTETWDLTLANEDIIADPDQYNFEYYYTQDDLNNGTNAITDASSFDSGATTIYVYVSNNDCDGFTTLELILLDTPEQRAVELTACANENGAFIFDLAEATNLLSDSPNDISFEYYNNINDAIDNNTTNAISSIDEYQGDDGEIIYVNLNNGSCSSVSEITLTHLPVPIATLAGPILACDIENNGSLEIDLTTLETDIIGTQTGIGLTYFTSQVDADNMQNEIANPASYDVQVGTVTIYVRLDNGSCYETTSFEVTVNSVELSNQSIVLCDIGDDGTEVFDLTLMNEEISNGVDDYTFSYFESYQDALNNVNEINQVEQYSSAGQIIYVTATNDEDCSAIAELELVLEALPTVNTDLYYPLCDPEFDGIYGFELTDLDNIVVSNPSGFYITYYSSLEDAQNGTNPLTQTDADAIRSVPMMVYVRVEKLNAEPMCVNYTAVELDEAEQTAINTSIAPIESCDDGNGFAMFDLNVLNEDITPDNTNPFISYYTSLEDAQSDNNPIDATNAQLEDGSIYVRVHAQGKCPSITEVDVIVNPTPLAEVSTSFESACINESIQISAVDYNPSYTYEWKDETGTVLGVDSTLDVYGENGDQNIMLVVTNPDTFCYSETEFEFDAIELPTITTLDTSNNSIVAIATGEGPFEYSLDGVNWQQNAQFDNLATGLYNVYIRTLNSQCEGIGMSTLILDVTNVITPNNDGYNDSFVIPYMDVFRDEDGNVQKSELLIFDRYGKLLLSEESSNAKTEFVWNGTFKNRLVNTGDYWYILKLADGRKASGHITVKNK